MSRQSDRLSARRARFQKTLKLQMPTWSEAKLRSSLWRHPMQPWHGFTCCEKLDANCTFSFILDCIHQCLRQLKPSSLRLLPDTQKSVGDDTLAMDHSDVCKTLFRRLATPTGRKRNSFSRCLCIFCRPCTCILGWPTAMRSAKTQLLKSK